MNIKLFTHKQRILFVGKNARELIQFTSKVFKSLGKDFDIYSSTKENLSDAPMILIEDNGNEYDPHIIVVGKVEDDLSSLEKKVDKLPKSGSIIFPSANKAVYKICNQERTDVNRIEYKPESNSLSIDEVQLACVRSLLTRIRIQKEKFNQVLKSL